MKETDNFWVSFAVWVSNDFITICVGVNDPYSYGLDEDETVSLNFKFTGIPQNYYLY